MTKAQRPELEALLISERENILESIQKLFKEKAVGGHLFGSLARGNSDAYSDVDIWFTFADEKIEEALNNRFDYYAQIGEIVHFCEPPQNAPINGVHTHVTYKTSAGYQVVDYYLCPLSTSHLFPESKILFGEELPVKTIGFNPQKVQVNESYRIDFFIIFIFSATKKLIRNQTDPLKTLFEEYDYLAERYGVPVEPLTTGEQNFNSLKKVIENVKKVANNKQQEVLNITSDFVKKIEAD